MMMMSKLPADAESGKSSHNRNCPDEQKVGQEILGQIVDSRTNTTRTRQAEQTKNTDSREGGRLRDTERGTIGHVEALIS
jgi:hypothetical protein